MKSMIRALATSSLFRNPRAPYPDMKKGWRLSKKRFNPYPVLISPHLIDVVSFTKGLVLQVFFRAPGKRFNQDPLLISIKG